MPRLMLPPSVLSLQHLLKISQSAGILGLTKPEERFLPNCQIRVRAGHMNQLRDALILGQLAQSEYGSLFHVGLRVILNRISERRGCPFSCLLCNPEERLPTDLWPPGRTWPCESVRPARQDRNSARSQT